MTTRTGRGPSPNAPSASGGAHGHFSHAYDDYGASRTSYNTAATDYLIAKNIADNPG